MGGLINEKCGGGQSPGCSSILVKSTDLPSILGGVPVLSLPTGNFNSFNFCARIEADGSPALPAS